MRRVRRLEQCDYVVPIGQKVDQVLILSNHCNVVLERTWHGKPEDFIPVLHAKFNSGLMNGFTVITYLEKDGQARSSVATALSIYRVNDSNFTESLISTVPLSIQSNGVFVATVTPTNLGSNELSGAETYRLETTIRRKKMKFRVSKYFNHLGCFDSINRLRQYAERLDLTKADL